eukprot:CAMPEP_0170406324 /NCGR_PEP_ID=MMETSP0117_2-20130122/27652_1 /TAXON_ID=400756 /ORGANISM="Durinskia baltica, Strain CSIRO CS-38" /LENGTH=356 /DNA_ID=CAMNT_0010663495 /DNA_START=50 /DNA_END=1120 /DNA_ORIENTATION=-
MVALYFISFLILSLALSFERTSAEDFIEQTNERIDDLAESPYFDAARTGNLHIIRKELGLGHDLNIKNQDGWSPLTFAVEAYQPHVITLLLNNGADPNVQDKDGWTPLMFAAHAGNTIAVGMLLKANANPLLANNNGFAPHSIAQFEGYHALARDLATQGLVAAMVGEDYKTMLVMITDGAPVNHRNEAGWTPLIAAVSGGDEETVRALLEYPDVDLNLAENDGWTPLMFAANNNRVQIAQLLIERGADASIKSRIGFYAQGIARDRNFKELASLIKGAAGVRKRYLENNQSATPQISVMRQESIDVAMGNGEVFIQEVPVDVQQESESAFARQQQPQQRKLEVKVEPAKKKGWLW